jgi:hypothetical protein
MYAAIRIVARLWYVSMKQEFELRRNLTFSISLYGFQVDLCLYRMRVQEFCRFHFEPFHAGVQLV